MNSAHKKNTFLLLLFIITDLLVHYRLNKVINDPFITFVVYLYFMKNYFFGLVTLLLFSLVNAQTVTIITPNNSWKYLDNGSDQGTVWSSSSFDDSTWLSGNTEFGYGDGDETTLINFGTDASNKYITTYFRKSFSINNPLDYTSLKLELIRDDAAIVYINGIEVYRNNLPNGDINYNTLAIENAPDESTWLTTVLPPSVLVSGTNVIAVEIHQQSITSSDISFNAKLSGLLPLTCSTPNNVVASIIRSSTATINWNATNEALNYNIQYRQIGSNTWLTSTSTTNSVNLTALQPSTSYEVQVQASCSFLSDFSTLFTFTTNPPTCDTPNLVAIESATSSAITLSWNAILGASSYLINYRLTGSNNWITTTSISNSKIITGLLSSTTYEFNVKAICDFNGTESNTVSYTTNPFGTDLLLAPNSTWKYLDNGSNQGTDWSTTSFNDSNWQSGNAEFGYGDGDETTLINFGTNASNKYVTTYFRKSFSINNPLDYTAIKLELIRDDAAIVYINGVEVYRNNLPTGTINFNTFASDNAPDESTWLSTLINPALLVSGTNSIAVEIHQQSETSSDISFNARISGTLPLTCLTPSNLTSSIIKSSTVTINWNATNDATSYNIQYRQLGSTTWLTSTSTSNFVNISGLLPLTSYEIQVQAVCSFLSNFSISYNFITSAPTCDAPKSLTVESASSTKSTLSWEEVSGATSYIISYRIAGSNNWTETISTLPSKLITGLQPSTTYEINVKAVCTFISNVSNTISFTTYPFGSDLLVAPNSTWKYLDNGSNQGSDWKSLSFNEMNWKSGKSELGYGDGDETTIVNFGANASNKYITTYFRKSFLVSNPLDYNQLKLYLIRDDAAVVYINGIEVYRNNLPDGTVNFDTLAIENTPDESTWLISVIDASLLVSGLNVIGVEIHQQSKTSSDISFNAQLFGNLQIKCSTPTTITTSLLTTTSATINWNATNEAINYNILYRQLGSSTWISKIVSSNLINFTSLLPDTSYEIQIQAACSFLSDYSPIYNFKTNAPTCDAPKGLKIESITSSIITLSWDEVADATSYIIVYRIASTNTWVTTTATSTSKSITGLLPSTTYDFIVKAVCIFVGNESNIISFTTYPLGIDFLIAPSTTWKYLDNGSNQGSVWYSNSFDDSTWKSGKSELGYGDGDETTIVGFGPDEANKYITTYFRKTFSIVNSLDYTSLYLELIRDDGAVVYLNGNEVYRNNLPVGTINYDTKATVSAVDESTWLTAVINPALLISGVNVIAVEIHQQSKTSSDISFNLQLKSNGSVINPIVTRGAYLQKLTPNSITIRWRTQIPCNSTVRFGTNLLYGNAVSDASLVTDHEITLTGLTPNTKYFYSIGTTSQTLQGDIKNNFYTAPIETSISPVRIWALGDFGGGGINQLKVRNSYSNYTGTNPTNLWIWLGDDAYNNGLDSEFQSNVFNQFTDQFKSMPLFPTMGDHDYAAVGYQSPASLTTNFPYFSIFSFPQNGECGGLPSNSPKYYSYNYANIHFVSLDGYGVYNDASSPMYTWLNNDLAANNQRWTIVYIHMPPYSQGSHNSDYEHELIDTRINLVPLLENYKVDLVLSGHSHTNERSYLLKGHFGNSTTFSDSMKLSPENNNFIKNSNNEGTVYAVCGTSAEVKNVTQANYPMPAMYFNNKINLCSLVIDVYGDNLNCKYLASTGLIVDDFTINKSNVATPSTNATRNIKDVFNVVSSKNMITLDLNLTQDSELKFEMYTLLGEKLTILDNLPNYKTKGTYSFETSTGDKNLVEGVYLIKLILNGKQYVKKVFVIR